MAKSTNGTKNLKEALTPDQVSKVEDKYKSIYSGMLKGNKKKLMKYIDPKLKRPNPDAMAMGRAINLVKKETETEPINEQMDAYDEIAQSEFGMDYEQLGAGEQEWVRDEIDNMELREELVNEEFSYDSFKTDESERDLNKRQVVELLPVLKSSLKTLKFNPTKQPTLSVERYGLSSSNKGYVIGMYIPTSKDDIIVELGKYPKDDKTDEVSISLYLPNEEGRLTQVAYETSTSPKGEELAEDSNVLSKVISMANQWYEKPTTMVKEEAGMPPSPNANTGDLFSSLEATGKLEAPQGGASMVGQKYTLNGDSKYDRMFFSYEPNSPTPFGLKQIGGHGLDSRFLSKFGLKPTQSWTAGVDQFIFDGNYNPRWFDEKRFGEIVDHFSGGLSREAKRQRDFYKDRGQTSGTIDERLATLVKEVYSEKQRKWACAQDEPKFDEMCKDTAISKTKLKEEKLLFPTQEEVDRFFEETQNEIHYLASKPVMGQEKTFNNVEIEPWDEYDLSNFNSLVRKKKDGRSPFGESKYSQLAKNSKKKLEEGIDFEKVASYFGMSWFEFYSKSPKVRKEMVERYKKDNTSLKEERTSTVSKSRAKSELKQMLKGKRDDGMGKSTLKAVLAIDKDGKETKVKKLEDFDKFEKGTKFSLKETTMNNDRLTELIKSALAGPVKEEAEANESFDSLAKKLDKQKGITKDEAAKIAGSIAAKKRAGAGKGPTAKQKKRMAESIFKKLRG